MIFARYNGAPSDSFTGGKVYLAKPEVDGAEMVGLGFLEVTDDAGHIVRVNPDQEQFEYFEEVYAVVVQPFEDLDAGEVVTLDGADENGRMYNLKGVGYRSAAYFVVLDRTNVFPGLNLLDGVSGRWVRVRQVDECLWVVVGESKKSRSPSEFTFAVANGDILAEPIVRCISDDGEPELTKGKLYVLRGQDKQGMVIVGDDSGTEKAYMPSRFLMGS